MYIPEFSLVVVCLVVSFCLALYSYRKAVPEVQTSVEGPCWLRP